MKAERWVVISGLAFIAILAVELFLTKREHAGIRSSMESAQKAERQNWLNLGNRDPHGAAHHGTFLFKSPSSLSVFDPGLFPYLGTSIRAEAHVRHRLTNRPAENDVQPMRNALTTPGELVQGALPLLLILLGCGSVAREREQRTLPLIRSIGVPWSLFVSGKIIAISIVALVLAFPYLGGLVVALVKSWGSPEAESITLRALLLLLVTGIYLAGWCCFVIAVSARTRSAQMALAVLLTFWGVTTACLPSLVTNLVALRHPPPSQEEVSKWSNQKKYGDGDSENIFSKIRKDLEKKMLAQYQVKSTEDLPFKFDGQLMIESEKVTDRFYEEDFDQLSSLLRPFEQSLAAASAASPYLAIHRLAMSLAGTDERHHKHFDEAAEVYRRHLVLVVNQADSQKESPSALRGDALWRSVSEFHYAPLPVRGVINDLWFPCLVLLSWTAASLFLATRVRDERG